MSVPSLSAGINARLAELERMLWDDDSIPQGDRRDSLEAEYDDLLDQLNALETKAA